VKQVCRELIERQAMGGAGLLSLFVQILDGGIEERQDGNSRVFCANLLNDARP